MKTLLSSLLALVLTFSSLAGGILADSKATPEPGFPANVFPFPTVTSPLAKLSNPEVYKRLLKSTVCVVQMPEEGNWYLGSGWVVDRERRLVVTNHHVVKLRDVVLIHFPAYRDGQVIAERSHYLANVTKAVRGRVLDSDTQRDLAVIQLDSLPDDIIALPLATESPRQGEAVHQVGNPSGSEAFWVFTTGAVRQVYHRTIRYRAQMVEAKIIESQAPSNAGDSGGPVVNDRGELVGTHTGSATDSRLITWHIDVSEVRSYVEQTRRLLKPGSAGDFNLRGSRLVLRNQLDRALADFTSAIQLAPKEAIGYQNRADVNIRKNDYTTALADAELAVKLGPNDASSFTTRGVAHELRDELDEALRDYTRAIQLKGDYALAFEYRGDVQAKKGEKKRALADYDRAIHLNPKRWQPLQSRGDIYRAQDKFDKALADYDRALTLTSNAELFNRAGICFAGLKDHAKAIACYTKALELDPKTATFHMNRARSWISQKQYDRAIADCTMAIKLKANEANHFFVRAKAYEHLNDDRSQADFTKAIELDPTYEEKAPRYNRRYLRIVNTSNEVIKVHVRYETWTTDKAWKWFPTAAEESVVYTFKPGESSYLDDDDFKINAREVRLWAKGETVQWNGHRDKALRLAPDAGYRATKGMATFTFTFNK